jgi:hypothetical protein
LKRLCSSTSFDNTFKTIARNTYHSRQEQSSASYKYPTCIPHGQYIKPFTNYTHLYTSNRKKPTPTFINIYHHHTRQSPLESMSSPETKICGHCERRFKPDPFEELKLACNHNFCYNCLALGVIRVTRCKTGQHSYCALCYPSEAVAGCLTECLYEAREYCAGGCAQSEFKQIKLNELYLSHRTKGWYCKHCIKTIHGSAKIEPNQINIPQASSETVCSNCGLSPSSNAHKIYCGQCISEKPGTYRQ